MTTETIFKKKLKYLELRLGTDPNVVDHACQLTTWKVNNNTDDGEVRYTFCYDPDSPLHPNEGETREDAEPSYSLSAKVFSDWRGQGLSRWSWQHNGEWVGVTIHHHPDDPASHVWWVGEVKVKAFSVGGDARTTEESEFEWQFRGEPKFYAESDLESDSN